MKTAFPPGKSRILRSQFSFHNAGNERPATQPGHAPAHASPIDPRPGASPAPAPAPAPQSADAPAAPKRRNPIQRLPSAVREQVNELIDDAKPFPEILQWLITSGHPAITEADLIAYAEGPFQRWVRDQERMDRLAAQHDTVEELAKGEHLHDFNVATTAIAQLTLFDVLNRFDSVTLSKALEKKPELWFQIIYAFCNFSRLKLAREKFEWQKKQAELKQRAREQKQRSRTPIMITADTVRSVGTLLQLLQPSPTPEHVAPHVVPAKAGAALEESIVITRGQEPIAPSDIVISLSRCRSRFHNGRVASPQSNGVFATERRCVTTAA